MPKTNDATGATAAGMTGIVEHGAPIDDGRKFSELDPELNLDGTLIDGEHPDHPKAEEREYIPAPGEPQPIERDDTAESDENAEDDSETAKPDGDIADVKRDETPANRETVSGRELAGKGDSTTTSTTRSTTTRSKRGS